MDIYEALADPVRRRIVELLAVGPLPARGVADAFGHISRPAVSRHLRVLREADLVEAELVGRERIYRARLDALDEVEEWIAGLRPRFHQQLDALETEVHRTRRERERREAEPGRPERSTSTTDPPTVTTIDVDTTTGTTKERTA